MLIPHKKQEQIIRSPARFKVVRAGRRSGKTTVETEMLLYRAVQEKNRRVFFIAPTQLQARSIVWEALLARLQKTGEKNEQRLEIKVPTVDGGTSLIKVAGWENRENFRGLSAHHITFDELDTMRDFYIGWQEIFRPALIDTRGTADFIGTPKKENPNLRRLEKEGQNDPEWASFHFTTMDNPTIAQSEIDAARQDLDPTTYKQEILAEYVDNAGALFRYTSLIDMFTNTITKTKDKFLVIDVADDGSDKTVFSFWEGMELYRVEMYQSSNTEQIIAQTREFCASDRIPMSNVAVDAIGVGAGVASSSLLAGITAFKSSYSAIRTDHSIVSLPNVHYTKDAPLISEYKNLRSQCIFLLADAVNNHRIAARIDDTRIKEHIIEELSHYQDVSSGDGKRAATPKEEIKELIGRSPDVSDTLIMRMYFEIRDKMRGFTSEQEAKSFDAVMAQFDRNQSRAHMNSTK